MSAHSESARLKSVFLKHAKDAFISDSQLAGQWQELNYLNKPHFDQALEEYRHFENLLKQHEVDIHYFPRHDDVSIDSIYCRDASITTDKGVIICNMGKSGRVQEPTACKNAYQQADIPILGEITAPGTLEGGDVAWLRPDLLAVGHTYRTNEAGIAQLKALLRPLGVEVVVASMPHYKGPEDVFHLMSVFSPVDDDLAVVYSPLMPINFRNTLLDLGYDLAEVPDEEFESMGCNVLAVAPRHCIMVSGNPRTKSLLEEKDCVVEEYNGNEISIKGGGGPTCLTRPLERTA
ncbi:MAG: arginine deiminase family protein [Fulvivirga sp.]|nr:arginine deiminase family protein [Fulvivirga sp.]